VEHSRSQARRARALDLEKLFPIEGKFPLGLWQRSAPFCAKVLAKGPLYLPSMHGTPFAFPFRSLPCGRFIMSIEQEEAGTPPVLAGTTDRATAASPAPWRLRLKMGGQTRDVSYEQAFVLGHELFRNRKFAQAAAVFEKLTAVPQRGVRAHVMLAICRAGLSDYQAAFAVLKQAFVGNNDVLGSALYEVIIQSRMGFKEVARQQLAQLANDHHELPTLCLWLGDMLEAGHQVEKAVECWKLAVRRDRRGGGVALAASQQLRRMKPA
jgi:tetratricopeptide (TPR) repeat protein